MDERQQSAGDDWFAAQRKYWDAWLDLTRQTSSGTAAGQPGAAGTWADALSKWWEAMSPAAPSAVQGFDERLLALGRAYFGLAERLAEPGGLDAAAAIEQWLDSVGRAFATVKDGASATADRGGRDALAFWDLPLDTWQRTISSMLPVPGDYLYAIHDRGGAREVTERLDRFMAIPAVGYSREAQDQYRKLPRLTLDYVKALQEYTVGLTRAGARSLDTFRKKVNDAAQSAPVDSVRKLYDLWVDACEEVHAEYVMSDEYAVRYGQMVNALMAVKRQSAVLVDEMLEGMNVPTRAEINAIQQRLQETRRANIALQAEVQRLQERVAGGAEGVHAGPARAKDRAAPSPAPPPRPKSKPRRK